MAPYLRIADELRRRIESGAWREGARVPSTRALARRWKVANATAAHALQVLVREGLVRTVPRSGNVVAARQQALSADTIVRAAIEIADAQGLEAVSMRALAARLQAPAMSLYRHVRSKDELVERMVDATIGELPLPSKPPPGWRAQLEVAARLEWSGMRRHPWLARCMRISRPSPAPHGLRFADWMLRALEGHGLDASLRMQLHIVLHGFVQGLAVNLEAEAQDAQETGVSEDAWMEARADRFAALAASGQFPAFGAAFAELSSGFDLDFDALFERGLAALLDGFEALITARRRAAGARPRAGSRATAR